MSRGKKIVAWIVGLMALMAVAAAGGMIALYFWAVQELPSFKKLTDYRPPLVTTVTAQDGRLLGYFYRERRFLVRLDQMSPWASKAFLAAEDDTFYQHEGVDVRAIFRAFVANLRAGDIRQGGSTITQQVIKRLLLSSEKSYERKLKEAILAYRLEKYLSKDEILTIYLNQIFFGAGAYGVEAAARTYFGKHAADLTLAEAALLAGLPKAPSHYDPYKHPELARLRQKYVLDRMLDLRWISRKQYEQAVNEPLVYQSMPDPSWSIGPYYLEEVRRQLIAMYGEDMVYEGGLTVRAACSLDHQIVADEALKNGLIASTKRRGWGGPVAAATLAELAGGVFGDLQPEQDLKQGQWVKAAVLKVEESGAQVLFGNRTAYMPVASMGWARKPDPEVAHDFVKDIADARKVLKKGDVVWASIQEFPDKSNKGRFILGLEQEPEIEGALVSMDPKTGDVLALSGGYSFARSQFNRATQAARQPGSAFKPIVYSAALDNGYTAASVEIDGPITYDDKEHNKIWRPQNFENKFYGPTLLRTALVKSRNLVTIRVAQKIGVDAIIDRAEALGLETDFPRDLSVALGSASVTLLNLCQAYTAFPRGGSCVKPRLILDVKSAWGDTMYASREETYDAISPQTAYIIASLMEEVVQHGTGFRAKVLHRPVAGKTGTSNNEQDAWFIGYTPYLLTGVFVGFDQVKPMGQYETGSRAAAPIFVEYRKHVEGNYTEQDFEQPPGIVMTRVTPDGLLAGPNAKESYFLPFKAGTQPTQTADDAEGAGGQQPSSGEDLFRQIF
ncbi:MAG: penicillin-binding protein 1A [Desulfovibrionaceae bacterium]